jgi:diphthamide biosynthesis methyltransferase
MVFYIIGLGLGDEEDITIKGFNAVKSSEKVFLEAYTSILGVKKDNLEKFYNKVDFLLRKLLNVIAKLVRKKSIIY